MSRGVLCVWSAGPGALVVTLVAALAAAGCKKGTGTAAGSGSAAASGPPSSTAPAISTAGSAESAGPGSATAVAPGTAADAASVSAADAAAGSAADAAPANPCDRVTVMVDRGIAAQLAKLGGMSPSMRTQAEDVLRRGGTYMKLAIIKACKDDGWSLDAIGCIATVDFQHAATCADELTDEQRDHFQKAVVQAVEDAKKAARGGP